MVKFIIFAFCGFVYCYSCNPKQPTPPAANNYVYIPVPNETTAKKIAFESWVPIYGEKVLADTPLICQLKDSVWVVEGTLHGNQKGGVPYIEIGKYDGRVYLVRHSK